MLCVGFILKTFFRKANQTKVIAQCKHIYHLPFARAIFRQGERKAWNVNLPGIKSRDLEV